MTRVPVADLLPEAVGDSSALLAFNAVTLEHVEAIVDGAERAGQPVVVAVSENAVRFHRDQLGPLAAAAVELAEAAAVPVGLHLDHVIDPALAQLTAAVGFSSVMFDAAAAPYEDNVAATASMAGWAHDEGLLIEAELGYIGGKGQDLGAHSTGVRTDPAQAEEYVSRTGVDALAVAVGSSHAMTSKTARLDLDLIEAIRTRVEVPLVLHGSSGVDEDDLRAAVGRGMSKINIGTALGVAYTGAVRQALDADADLVDPRRFLVHARRAMSDEVVRVFEVLGGS